MEFQSSFLYLVKMTNVSRNTIVAVSLSHLLKAEFVKKKERLKILTKQAEIARKSSCLNGQFSKKPSKSYGFPNIGPQRKTPRQATSGPQPRLVICLIKRIQNFKNQFSTIRTFLIFSFALRLVHESDIKSILLPDCVGIFKQAFSDQTFFTNRNFVNSNL